MTPSSKAILAMAEQHVLEGEARVARLERIIEELDRDNHSAAAVLAREVLTTLRHSLELAREHLRIEREARPR